MFFALAMLFCLGNIQGNPVPKPDNHIEYISDRSPPVLVSIIGIQTAEMNLLERGASMQIIELCQAQSVNERITSPVLYINDYHQNRLIASYLGLRSASQSDNLIETKQAHSTTQNNFRAREKV